MYYKVYVHPIRPKIPRDHIKKILKDLQVCLSSNKPDIAIVIGGDGTFGYYGRILNIPMLFVGLKEPNVLGSKARLAEIFLEDLPHTITQIERGRYRVESRRLINVRINRICKRVFTDLYLERGNFGGCMRYLVTVKRGKKGEQSFIDYGIGNGVIISTSIGSSGYFSYPQRLISEQVSRDVKFGLNKIGICHINPDFLERKVYGSNSTKSSKPRLQYTVPIISEIVIKILRPRTAFLYGLLKGSGGTKITRDNLVHVSASNHKAKIIRVKNIVNEIGVQNHLV